MSPEFICVYSQATLPEVFERIRGSRASAEAIASIYVMNTRKRLHGALALADLLRAEEGQRVGEIAGVAQRLRPDADLEEVARLMTDYDLTVVPVVDEEDRLLGVITVDDVLERWREVVRRAIRVVHGPTRVGERAGDVILGRVVIGGRVDAPARPVPDGHGGDQRRGNGSETGDALPRAPLAIDGVRDAHPHAIGVDIAHGEGERF